MAEIDFSQLGKEDRLHLLTSGVVPRPIALVTTICRLGKVNTAPFSFFNVLSYEPELVALGIGHRKTGELKDTARNIAEGSAFVVGLVTESMVNKVNICAIDFPQGDEEAALSGLSLVDNFHGSTPRIADCPISLACAPVSELRYGSHMIILGRVEKMWLDDELLDEENGIVHNRLNLVARLGGTYYARNWERFSLPRLNLPDWQALQSQGGPYHHSLPDQADEVE